MFDLCYRMSLRYQSAPTEIPATVYVIHTLIMADTAGPKENSHDNWSFVNSELPFHFWQAEVSFWCFLNLQCQSSNTEQKQNRKGTQKIYYYPKYTQNMFRYTIRINVIIMNSKQNRLWSRQGWVNQSIPRTYYKCYPCNDEKYLMNINFNCLVLLNNTGKPFHPKHW